MSTNPPAGAVGRARTRRPACGRAPIAPALQLAVALATVAAAPSVASARTPRPAASPTGSGSAMPAGARAQVDDVPSKAGSPSGSLSGSPAPAGGASNNAFNFDLLGSSPAAAVPAQAVDPSFEARVHRRRRMLLAHQVFGGLTLASLAATLVVGQLNYQDKFGGGGDTGRYYWAHAGLAGATTALFLTTGALALFAPVPYAKDRRLDTTMVHKIGVTAATLGMLAEVALGFASAHMEGHLVQRDLALSHQIVGYATFGCLGIAAMSLLF